MASHMSALGFPAATNEDFQRLMHQAAQKGLAHPLDNGRLGYYIHWAVGEGVEIWAQANPQRELISLNPHFAGQTQLQVGLISAIPNEKYPLDGAFYGWVNPAADDLTKGDFPFVFDSPAFVEQHPAAFPLLRPVQISAFAHRLDAYPDESSYLSVQKESLSYAPESFIPSGLFVKPGETPAAYAFLSGRVLATQTLVNPLTHNPFIWAQVKTFGGEIDIVADPAVVVGEVIQGGLLSGAFWLSGFIHPAA